MSHLFESIGPQDAGSDERVLGNLSLRSAFALLVADLLLLGALGAAILYDILQKHRFDWSAALPLVALSFTAFRIARVIYRRLPIGSD
jgi:hypothetical protein